jgi:flagellin
MPFSVNTNAGAFAALQNLSNTTGALNESQTRINTGLRVSSSKDDAAAFAIAQRLRGDLAGLNAVNLSLSRAASELDVAIAGAEAVSDLLVEMKEKAVAAKDSGLDTASRSALNNDFKQLRDQINTIVTNATFNGKNALTGDGIVSITDATGANTITVNTTSLTLYGLRLQDSDISTVSGTTTTVTPTALSSLDDLVISSVETLDGGSNEEALNAMLNLIDDEANESALSTALANNGASISDLNNSLDRGTGLISDANVLAGLEDFLEAQVAGSDFGADLGTPSLPDNLEVRGGTIYVAGSGTNAYFTTSGADVQITIAGASDAVTKVEEAIDTVNDVLSQLGSGAQRIQLQQEFSQHLSDSISGGIGNLVDANLAKEAATLQSLQSKQQLGLQALSIANQAPQTVLSLFR